MNHFSLPALKRPFVLPAWPESAAPPVYSYLHGGRWEGNRPEASPDPLRGYVWGTRLVENPLEPLQCYAILPVGAVVESGSVVGLETLSRPGSRLDLSGEVSLRLDFGVESAAWLEFETDDPEAEFRCSISEYNRPGMVNAGAEAPEKTGVPERIGATRRLKLNTLNYEGLRFAWLRLAGRGQRCTVRNLRAVCQIKPANYRGAFQSSEPLLDRIWETGAYAVKLNLHEDYFGSILMERGDRHSWTGDAYVTQAASLPAFGNAAFVRQNTQRMQDDDNGIESYALYWVLALADYVLWSADGAFWESQLARTAAKLEHAGKVALEPDFLGYKAFCGHDDRMGGFVEDTPPGNRRLYLGLARRAAQAVLGLLEALPPTDGSDRLRAAGEALLPLTARAFGVETGQLGLHDGTEALLAGLVAPASPQAALARRIYADPVRSVSYSPFNGYFVLEGMARAGAWEAAGALLDRCWGGMLRLGATTFWECFRPEWLEVMAPNDPIYCGTQGYTSLCHPWSGGPTRWLADHVLGVTPSTPGWTRIRVAVDSGLAASVRGTLPTPLGPVAIEREAGTIRIELPAGMSGEGPEGEALREGTNRLESRQPPRPVALSGFDCDHDWNWLPDGDPTRVPGADWVWVAFAAEAAGDVSSGFEHVPFSLEADIEGEVELAEGLLPGGPQSRSNLARREHWSGGEDAPVLLRGALRGRAPEPCQQTVRLRLLGDLSGVEEVALWFADPHEEGLMLSVEVLAEPDRHMVLPIRRVDDIGAGKVLRFRPEGACLLRVCSRIDRPDASLSGIALRT